MTYKPLLVIISNMRECEVCRMAWSYKKLWIMLIEKGINRTELRLKAGISTSALAHMGKDEPVTMDVLGKICETMNCRIEDIVEYVPE